MKTLKQIISAFVTFSFLLTSFLPNQSFAANNTLNLPAVGAMVHLSQPLTPVMLKGLHINPKDPLVFDFLVSKGEANISKEEYTQEVEKLSRYFLASMTIPENELWVNLSPFEKEKIITDSLSKTDMGQNMLVQDYLLKQLTASMIYPEKDLGKEFWSRVYAKSKEQLGRADVTVNTFNKVWILADTANAVEKNNAVFITDTHLKVMLEEDYLAYRQAGLATRKHQAINQNTGASQVIREVIIPQLEKEVNTGANFAPLRQIFNAFVLSTWYKKALKEAILNQVYTDKSKIGGITADDLKTKQKIYDQYIQAYKKGVFNYIKDPDPTNVGSGAVSRLPRKYFSGGEVISAKDVNYAQVTPKDFAHLVENQKGIDAARVRIDAAMNVKIARESNYPTILDSLNVNRFGDEQANVLAKAQDITKAVITSEVLIDASKWLGVPVKVEVKELRDEDNILNGEKVIRAGYAIRHNGEEEGSKAIIYVTKSFRDKIEKEGGLFHFYARKIYKVYGTEGRAGRAAEVAFIKRKIEEERALLKDKTRLTKTERAINQLFPTPEDVPTKVLERIKDSFLFDPEEIDTLTQEDYEARVKALYPNRAFSKVITPGSVAKDAVAQAYAAAKENMNIMYTNALDGVVDFRTSPPYTVEQMVEYVRKNIPVTFAFGASKYNPSSIGHVNVTIGSVFALSGAPWYIPNVTKKDSRKPTVYKSFRHRLSLAGADLTKLFHRLLTILDVRDKVGGEDLGEYNGEEVFYLTVKTLVDAGLKDVAEFYTAGDDHFYVWAPSKKKDDGNFIQWDAMPNDEIRKHYVFYVEKGGDNGWRYYQELVRRQHGLSLENPTAQTRAFYKEGEVERKNVVDAIIKAATQAELLGVLQEANELPQLDTAGKMFIIRNIFKDKVTVVLAHTLRVNQEGQDTLRDHLLESGDVLEIRVRGISSDVSATANRDFLKAIVGGVFNYNLGYGLTKGTLENLKEDPEIERFLLRQNNVVLPFALPLLLPHEHPLKATQAEKKNKLNQYVQFLGYSMLEGIAELDGTPGDESFVKVIDSKGQEVAYVVYNITNGLREQLGGQLQDDNIVKFFKQDMSRTHADSEDVREHIKAYIKDLNNAHEITKDAAMFTEEEDVNVNDTNNVGGIELAQDDLTLNIQKDGTGVQFSIDPQLLEQLRSDNFAGFKPTVLDITPMSLSNPILN